MKYTHGGQDLPGGADQLAPPSNNVSTKSGNLTTIPRRSTISDVKSSDSRLGGSVSFKINRKSTNFVHQVWYQYAGQTDWTKLSGQYADSCTFTPPKSLAKYIPNTTSGTLHLCVRTLSGNNAVGDDFYDNSLSLSISTDTIPSVGTASYDIINNQVPIDWNVIVEGISQIKISISNSVGIYGSTIKSYSITGPGINTSSSSATSSRVPKGELVYVCKVMDSRGQVGIKEIKLSSYAYTKPTVSVSAYRSTLDGVASTDGQYLTITPKYSVQKIGTHNTVTKQLIRCNDELNKSTDSFTSETPFTLDTNCLSVKNYIVTMEITDAVGMTSTATANVSTSHRIINVRSTKKGITFGGFSLKDIFEVNMPAEFNQNIKFNKDIYFNTGPTLVDTRSVNESPLYYQDKIGYDSRSGIYGSGSIYEFKYCNAIGLTNEWISTTYCTLITMKPWGDPSGGPIRQLAFPDGYNTFFSRLSNSDWSGWGTWNVIEADSCWLRNKTWTDLIATNNISGANIECKNRLTTHMLQFYNDSNIMGGRIYKNVDFNIVSNGEGGGQLCLQDRNNWIYYNGVPRNNWTGGEFFPGVSGIALGKSGDGGTGRWYRLYASNAPDISSDERLKTHIQRISDYSVPYSMFTTNSQDPNNNQNLFESIYMDLIPKTFFMKTNNQDKMHIGFVAQDIAKTLEKYKCSENDLDLIQHEYWTDETTGESKDEYSLCYEEFVALNTYMVQQCMQKINTLEAEIESLKAKLTQ